MLDPEEILRKISEERIKAREARRLRSELRARRRRAGQRSMRMTPELHAALVAAATSDGLSVNAFLVRLLKGELASRTRATRTGGVDRDCA